MFRDLKVGAQDSGWRIPAKTIEPVVMSLLKDHLTDDRKLMELLQLDRVDVTVLQAILASGKALANKLNRSKHHSLRPLLSKLIDRIVVEQERVSIHLSPEGLSEYFPIDRADHRNEPEPLCITAPINIRRRGQEMKILLGGKAQPFSKPDEALILLIARAALLKEQLQTKEIVSISEFAEVNGMHHSDAKKLVPLGYLAPSIIEDILAGRQPVDLTAGDLHRLPKLPLCWSEQRSRLGFH